METKSEVIATDISMPMLIASVITDRAKDGWCLVSASVMEEKAPGGLMNVRLEYVKQPPEKVEMFKFRELDDDYRDSKGQPLNPDFYRNEYRRERVRQRRTYGD